jgi:hypothetical protein
MCSACQRKGVDACHFEEPAARTARAGSLVEAVSLLNCLSPSQLNSALLSLSEFDRESEVITTLREVVRITAQPSLDIPRLPTSFARILEAKHPFTYPVFEPIDPNEANNHLKRLVTPRSKPFNHHENMPYAT